MGTNSTYADFIHFLIYPLCDDIMTIIKNKTINIHQIEVFNQLNFTATSDFTNL